MERDWYDNRAPINRKKQVYMATTDWIRNHVFLKIMNMLGQKMNHEDEIQKKYRSPYIVITSKQWQT